MAVESAKSIAEFAIRRWVKSQNFDMRYFNLIVKGNEADLVDGSGNSIKLVYDNETKSVVME